ncbi:hypothetical protein RhiirB3_460148 [Rhizophagus irregularis]|nr:hypothetical protein RhiirB3_460148 [Rhizophagus irregularis]
MLNFEVNYYMVECNISFNYLNEYNLCEEFFSLLSQQPTGVSLNILNLKYKLVNESTYIPYYCGMVRKVIVTPTTSYILIPTMETSHRVIRHFHDIIEIPDMIVRNGFTFSDGVGNISFSLAKKIASL